MPYVPQRKAAVKATAQIKDADKPMSKKEEELVLFGEPENKKGKKSSAEADAKAKKLPLWKRYAYILAGMFNMFLYNISIIFQDWVPSVLGF